MKKQLAVSLLLVLVLCVSVIAVATADTDLSVLSLKELEQLQTDIDNAYKAYHKPTDSQKNAVLTATQNETHKYYSQKSIEVSGWAWYDSEYTYTRDWDFYTLKTHLDYKDSDKRSRQAKIYAEVYNKDGKYIVSYLKTDDTVILDERSDYRDVLWFSTPKAMINKTTNIDFSTYTIQELNNFSKKVQKEIDTNHTVSQNEANVILSLTKSDLEQYFLKKNYELKSYAWYDSEYTYSKDWDYYWLETHVDYKTNASSSQKTDKLYSEVCKIGGSYELVYLKMGGTVIKDRKNELATSSESGIPRYSWAGKEETKVADNQPEMTPQIIYVTPEPATEVTPQIVYVTPEPVKGLFSVNVTEMSDEQLEEAALAIQKEQRARIKTKIKLDKTELAVAIGKNDKITASVIDLPEGEKAPKFSWASSDSKIVTCNNGNIKGVSGGTALVTCSATLADGTEIREDCSVRVIVPVQSIASGSKTLKINGGQSVQLEITVKPENASDKTMTYISSDENVVTVDQVGKVTGVGKGTAKITIQTADGSNKSVTVSVTVEDRRISKMVAKRVVYTGIGNAEAMDVYTSDGSEYDKRKFHAYGYMQKEFNVVREGEWTTKDDGNTWHVEGLLLQHKIYGGYYLFKFDVRFDGTNYLMENGWRESAGQLKWLENKDPSKWNEDDLSNLEFNTCFVVSPSLIK